MTLNDSKYYLSYLNKLVEEYNNIYHRPVSKKPIDAGYSALNDENESSHKVSKFKVDERVRITKYKDIFSKDYTKNWSRVIFVIDFVLKTNPWTYKINDLNEEKWQEAFMKKNCCWLN